MRMNIPMRFSYINGPPNQSHILSVINIHSFDHIRLRTQKPLILCDIDETILTTDENESENKTGSFSYGDIPKHTDYYGFQRLIERVDKLNGEIQFLTARSAQYHYITRLHFDHIGVDYDSFKINYTDGGPKGEYIKKNIDLSGYGEVIFIDDRESFLMNVKTHHPQITCYKFII